MTFKAGDTVRINNNCSGCNRGEIYTLHNGDVSGEHKDSLWAYRKKDFDKSQGGCSCESNWVLIKTKSNKMGNLKSKTKRGKASWKVGDRVYNNYHDQKSTVEAVVYDDEDGGYKYLVKCLDDEGSVHLLEEDSVEEIEVRKMTVAELKEYYEEAESVEVSVTK